MTGLVFVDTNILVYCRDASEPEKQQRARLWMTRLWEERRGRLSYQVLNEFYVTVTQKLKPGMPRELAREDVRLLAAWAPVGIDVAQVERAWQIQDLHGLAWWDALIVSAASGAGCRYLLTEDLQPRQRIDGVTVVNPFSESPDDPTEFTAETQRSRS